MKLPEQFQNRMKKLLGKDFDKFIYSYNEKPTRALRVNTLKMSINEFEKNVDFWVEKIPYIYNGYLFDYDGIGNHPLHLSGCIYVQEPAAMAVAEALYIQKDDYILDVCAAPGGKSTQVGEKNTGGVIVSNEKIFSRMQVLMQNTERLGLRNSVVMSADSEDLAHRFPELFDIVMVDAPCSGEGMMRKNPLAVSEWSEENVMMCAERQFGIISNSAKAVIPGGYLAYSTCTFSLEENEMLVDRFLSENEDFELVQVQDKIIGVSSNGVRFKGCLNENIEYCRRFYPHVHNGEGQFLALMKRKGEKPERIRDKSSSATKNKQLQTDVKIVKSFIKDCLTTDGDCDIDICPDGAYIVADRRMDGPFVFSNGVKVGVLQKGRVVPNHRFFMAYGQKFKRKIELSDRPEILEKYLCGETFEFDGDSGYAVVTYCGAPLGGVKISTGTAKNLYPKGIRKQGRTL